MKRWPYFKNSFTLDYITVPINASTILEIIYEFGREGCGGMPPKESHLGALCQIFFKLDQEIGLWRINGAILNRIA